MLILILILTKADSTTKKYNRKQDMIRANNNGNIKIFFILLTEVVTLYMKLFIVEIGETNF